MLGLRRKWAAVFWYLAGLTAATPWFVWVFLHNGASGVDPYYSASPYGSWNVLVSYGLMDKLRVVGLNLTYVCSTLTEIWGLRWQGVLAWLLTAPLALCIGIGLWRGRKNPVGVVLAVYMAMVLLWVWYPVRFLLPLTPLLIWFGIVGAGRGRAGYVVLVVLLGASVSNLGRATCAG